MDSQSLQLTDIQLRCAKASEGPWIQRVPGFIETASTPHRIVGVTCKGLLDSPIPLPYAENAEFIAAARTDVPRLVAEVERLKNALERIAGGDVGSPSEFARSVVSEETNRVEQHLTGREP